MRNSTTRRSLSARRMCSTVGTGSLASTSRCCRQRRSSLGLPIDRLGGGDLTPDLMNFAFRPALLGVDDEGKHRAARPCAPARRHAQLMIAMAAHYDSWDQHPPRAAGQREDRAHRPVVQGTPEDIRRAEKKVDISAVQNVLSTTDRYDPALELCRDLGIPYVPYWPLNAGTLAKAQSLPPCIDCGHGCPPVSGPQTLLSLAPRWLNPARQQSIRSCAAREAVLGNRRDSAAQVGAVKAFEPFAGVR
ncbi:aldo/keto reductase [Streptomyces sp. NPDC055749]